MRIQFRRDSSAAWATFNTILAEAELGWDRTVKRFKIGDGITTWQNLPWYSTGEGGSGGLVDSVNGQIGTVILDAEDVGAAPLAHTHAISGVTGLQAALEGKQPSGAYASSTQGALADSAVQPEELAAVATTGEYSDLSGSPTIPDPADFATAAQGVLADSAVQPGDLTTALSNRVINVAGVAGIWAGTQAAYDLLTPDASTLYIITAP